MSPMLKPLTSTGAALKSSAGSAGVPLSSVTVDVSAGGSCPDC